MFNHPKLEGCLTNWAKKKINPQTKLAVHCLINFDNLWKTRKAVSIRDICPVSLIPSVFQQAVSAIQAHMVIYNSRDSTPKINCYWQTFTYERMRRGAAHISCSPSKPISPSLCTLRFLYLFQMIPHYYISSIMEVCTDSEHTIIWHRAFDRCMLLSTFASSVWTEIAVNALAAGL